MQQYPDKQQVQMDPSGQPLNNNGYGEQYEKEDQRLLGLKLSNQIHNEYGEEFKKRPVDRASGYAAFIKFCGMFPKIACCICAPCGKGPVAQIKTG